MNGHLLSRALDKSRHQIKIKTARVICFICLLISFWLDPMILFNLGRATVLEVVLLVIALSSGVFMIAVSVISKKE